MDDNINPQQQMQPEQQKPGIKGKLSGAVSGAKNLSMKVGKSAYSAAKKGTSLFMGMSKRSKIITIAVASAVVIGIILLSSSGGGNQSAKNTDPNRQLSAFPQVLKGTSIGTADVGSTAYLGDLEITVQNFNEGSYIDLAIDPVTGQRIQRGYGQARIKIFNTSSEDTDIIYFGMTDDLGNQYDHDSSVAAFVGGAKDFGRGRQMFPRTIREGSLLFSEIDENANSVQLIFYSDVRQDKVIFEIER